jgi:hypothetical protein
MPTLELNRIRLERTGQDGDCNKAAIAMTTQYDSTPPQASRGTSKEISVLDKPTFTCVSISRKVFHNTNLGFKGGGGGGGGGGGWGVGWGGGG